MPDELLNNYEIGEEIGYGHYALVRVVKDINTGYEFALKIIDLKKCVGKESMIENELAILRKIKHPNIVKLVEEYKSDEYFYLIMEYLKGGDLLESLTAYVLCFLIIFHFLLML
jgi:serine/threonine protein kinase